MVPSPPRKVIASLAFAVLMSTLLPGRGRAEPIGPWLAGTQMVSEGRYAIASYTGPYFVIWDLERIWDRHQPTQVLVVQTGVGNYNEAMSLAASPDGKWLAFQDWASKDIVLCEMRARFPCRVIAERQDRVLSMALSPDSDQILLHTATSLLLFAPEQGTSLVLPLPARGASCLAADWEAEIGAAGTLDGNLYIFDLASLDLSKTIQHAPARSCQLYLTGDKRHLISSWEREVEVDGVIETHNAVMIDDLRQSSAEPVALEGEVFIVPGDGAGELWYAVDAGGGAWSLAPLAPGGELLTEGQMQIVTGPDARLLAVSRAGRVILLTINRSHFVYDLQSRLPIAELFASKVNYYGDERTLPHLTPGLGADPAYHQLEVLSAPYGTERPLNWYTFPTTSFKSEKKEILLWAAALLDQRGDRYDALWFDLLPVYRQEPQAGRAYVQLNALCRLLVQLNYAEYLLEGGLHERAFITAREALRALRDTPELGARPGKLDIYQPDLSDLVLHYLPVLESHLWLVMGDSLAHQGAFPQAELAFRGALRSDPQQWRAYEGLLRTQLGGDGTRLRALLAEAQAALNLGYWNDLTGTSKPLGFFLEAEIARLRGSDLAFPGSSLNWGHTP